MIEIIILSGINPICSQIVCYDRSNVALILSSIFSIVSFIVLFLKAIFRSDVFIAACLFIAKPVYKTT